jgi:hypothetical protein
MLRRVIFSSLAFTVFALNALSQPTAAKTYLWDIAGGLPNDTGTDDTKLSFAEKTELGGKALKVLLVNSFGDRSTRVSDWRPFTTLAFNAFNPDTAPVKVGFNVRHQGTKNYATRVDVPITLKPGKNEIRLAVSDLRNSNGTVADLGNVQRWYIATDMKGGVTLYFSDIWLEGGEKAAAGGGKVHSDPARLARIKAAKMPKVDRVIEFNTPEADAICSALEVFPENNPWNLVVEDWPVHPNSKAIVNRAGAKKVFRYDADMSFIIVPPNQKRVDVKNVGYAEESDRGPFPIPANVPIEGWPVYFQRGNPKHKALTLDDVQRDKLNEKGDRHAVVLDPTNRMIYEFYQLKKSDGGWQAGQTSIFDLKSNKLRPDGWTSTDAAGLPIFPATVRYDEIKRGIVEHAMRVTFEKTRRAYVHPATHYASKHTDADLPRMGERFRLRQDFDIKGFSPEVQAILKGLKKYGMITADNGNDWAISVAPDPRIPNIHEELRKIKGSDFEVVTPPAGYVPAQ